MGRPQRSTSLSACDEVELPFLIDNNFLLNELENLKHFLSEYTSYSIFLYGNNIPLKLNQNIKILDSINTYNILQRNNIQTSVIQKRKKKYLKIVVVRAFPLICFFYIFFALTCHKIELCTRQFNF